MYQLEGTSPVAASHAFTPVPIHLDKDQISMLYCNDHS